MTILTISALQMIMVFCDYSNTQYTLKSRNACLKSIANCDVIHNDKIIKDKQHVNWCINKGRDLLKKEETQ